MENCVSLCEDISTALEAARARIIQLERQHAALLEREAFLESNCSDARLSRPFVKVEDPDENMILARKQQILTSLNPSLRLVPTKDGLSFERIERHLGSSGVAKEAASFAELVSSVNKNDNTVTITSNITRNSTINIGDVYEPVLTRSTLHHGGIALDGLGTISSLGW